MVLLAVPDIIYLILSLNSKILLFKTSSFSETFRESLFSKIFVSGFNSASCVIDSYRSTTSADTKRTSLKIALILLLLLIKSLESLKSLILKPRLPTLVWDENLKTQRFFCGCSIFEKAGFPGTLNIVFWNSMLFFPKICSFHVLIDETVIFCDGVFTSKIFKNGAMFFNKVFNHFLIKFDISIHICMTKLLIYLTYIITFAFAIHYNTWFLTCLLNESTSTFRKKSNDIPFFSRKITQA